MRHLVPLPRVMVSAWPAGPCFSSPRRRPSPGGRQRTGWPSDPRIPGPRRRAAAAHDRTLDAGWYGMGWRSLRRREYLQVPGQRRTSACAAESDCPVHGHRRDRGRARRSDGRSRREATTGQVILAGRGAPPFSTSSASLWCVGAAQCRSLTPGSAGRRGGGAPRANLGVTEVPMPTALLWRPDSVARMLPR